MIWSYCTSWWPGKQQHREAPNSCNTTVYLSWLLHSEKKSGEGGFTLGEFTTVNMKKWGCHNVRKIIEIKGSDNYVTLDISLKFDSLDNMRITSSWSKDNFVRSGKGFINSLGIKAKLIPKRYKNSRYAIGNVSKKELSKIIREFENFPYKSYERRRPKHDPNDSYFYLARQL